MMSTTRPFAVGLLGLSLAASGLGTHASAAVAAAPTPITPAPLAGEYPISPPRAEDYRATRPGTFRTREEAYLEDWLVHLWYTLRITETQRPLWERFAESVRNNLRERPAAQAPRDPRAGPPSLLERMERRRIALDTERARLDATDAALRPLYTAFSEEQRRIADRVLRPRGAAAPGMPPRRAMFRAPRWERGWFGRL